MTETEIVEWAKKLTKRFDNVKIVGSQGEWSGDARQGFMFNPKPIIPTTTITSATGACCFDDGTCAVETQAQCFLDGGTYQGDGTGCFPNPCEVQTGACCRGSVCTIESQDDCVSGGGIYHGDGTVCEPNPCETPTGACCIGDVCSILSEEDCGNSGGTYQGDDTLCEPNPCLIPPCNGCTGFTGFLDPTTVYLTKVTVRTVNTVCHCCRIDQCSFPACTGTWTVHESYNPITCEYSTFETGRTGHCAACKFPHDPCCVTPFPPCTDAGSCSDSGDCGNPSFDFDMSNVNALCFGAGSCGATPDSDSHASCFAGYAFCYICGDPPTGDCNCTCGAGSDVVFTEEVTLSNQCIP